MFKEQKKGEQMKRDKSFCMTFARCYLHLWQWSLNI